MSDATTAAFRRSPVGTPVGHGADLVRERARAEGFAAGYTAGARVAAREAEELRIVVAADVERAEQQRQAEQAVLLVALRAAADAASARTAPVVADAQATLFAAAVELASVIVGRELTVESSAAVDALNRVLAEAPGVVTVRMNPDDLAAVQPVAPQGVELIADPTLVTGDAISEHSTGYIDARVSTALARASVAVNEVGA